MRGEFGAVGPHNVGMLQDCNASLGSELGTWESIL